MLESKVWLSGLVALAIATVPLYAQNNRAGRSENALSAIGADGGTYAAIPDPTSVPVPKPAAAISAVNLPALLDALLKKGVLTPSEVNSLHIAAPDSELQLLVEVLTRKGVLNAADLSPPQPRARLPAPCLRLSRRPPPCRNPNSRN